MAFGVDFGTSNSVVARWNGYRTEVLPIDSANVPAQWREPEFEQLFPSVLSVRELQRTLSFGWAAKASNDPVDAVKRMLGTRPAAKDEEPADDALPHLEEPNVWIGGEPYRSTAAAGALFERMRSGVRESLLDMSEAVVTVPANATGGARYRTRAAARLAGIRVKALINEPTAAAISYAHEVPDDGRFLVFDWGGGTIDVTVLELADGLFEEQASRGIAALGGLEFDEALASLVLKKIGQAPENLSPRERKRWRRDVELTKIALSRPGTKDALVDLPTLREPVLITQEEYTEAIRPLISRAMEPVEQCLEDLRIDPSEIDTVLMIGGTSQIPQVREELSSVMPADRILPSKLCKPMTAVARGAAIFAAALDGKLEKTDISLVTSYDLGAAFDAGPRKGFIPIIPRNSTLRAEGEKTFQPNTPHARWLTVEVIEGEEGYSADSDRAFPLTTLKFPLPRAEEDPSSNRVRISFRYDRNGILKVKAVHEKSGTVLQEEEIDSFGPDGTPLQEGLDRELARLISHINEPFGEHPVEGSRKQPDDHQPSLAAPPPAASAGTGSQEAAEVSVNGIAQQLL
ncbi:Hsp70 family protein [Streptomyces sp. URMC 125]|uniref:Hsp70 family protein n=1 Tax=Streptomyces sp. URMC 125 TaxID=3423419 RepID=UPI003F1AD260